MKTERKIKIIELFSGIGSVRKALINNHIEPIVQFISEVDKSAFKAYQAIFNDEEVLNLGDIRKITNKQLKPFVGKCDLLVFGSPCQDFSHAGKNKGGQENSKTRSSLLWEAVRIIIEIKPGIVLFENVKALYKNPKHKEIFDLYLLTLQQTGYEHVNTLILNSRNFGIPQNRERLFQISCLNDETLAEIMDELHLDKLRLGYKPLKNFLEETDFNKRICLEKEIENRNWTNFATWNDKKGNTNSSYCRSWYTNCYVGTLMTSQMRITNGKKASYITPRESFRLMGFNDTDYDNVYKVIQTPSILLRLAGNSIVVDVIQVILRNLIQYY